MTSPTASAHRAFAYANRHLDREIGEVRKCRAGTPDDLVILNFLRESLAKAPAKAQAGMQTLLALALLRLASIPEGSGLELVLGDSHGAAELLVTAEQALEVDLGGAIATRNDPEVDRVALFAIIVGVMKCKPETSLLVGAAAVLRLAERGA